MKSFIITAGILLSVITASSQQIKSTVGERLTKYIPLLKPTPCSVFLVDYTATEGTVKTWADNLGLRQISTMYPDDSAQYVLQYVDPENSNILYGFVHKKKTRTYIGAFAFIQFKDHFTAIEQMNDIQTQMYFGWGNRTKEETNARATCSADGTDRFITVSRNGNTLMITTISLTLMSE